jgi:hypothetical protein
VEVCREIENPGYLDRRLNCFLFRAYFAAHTNIYSSFDSNLSSISALAYTRTCRAGYA